MLHGKDILFWLAASQALASRSASSSFGNGIKLYRHTMRQVDSHSRSE
jgi:hypothetical protein